MNGRVHQGPVGRILERLQGVEPHNGFYRAFCPAHEDRNTPNLDVKQGEDGRALLICRAGCSQDKVIEALQERGVRKRELFAQVDGDEVGERGASLSPESTATPQPRPEKSGSERGKALHPAAQPPATPPQPCTLETYAEAKQLPVEFLRELGLSTISYMGAKAVRMPYLTEDGQEGAVRLRLALEKGESGDNRFRWRKGSKPTLYGLWRKGSVREAGYVVLVEGESDCHTLWNHGVEALGVPGASNWKGEWASYLDGIEKVYAVVEPDAGGDAFRDRLTATPALCRTVCASWSSTERKTSRSYTYPTPTVSRRTCALPSVALPAGRTCRGRRSTPRRRNSGAHAKNWPARIASSIASQRLFNIPASPARHGPRNSYTWLSPAACWTG